MAADMALVIQLSNVNHKSQVETKRKKILNRHSNL